MHKLQTSAGVQPVPAVPVSPLSAEGRQFDPFFLGMHLPFLHPSSHLGAQLLEILKAGGSWSISALYAPNKKKSMVFSLW